MERAMKREAGVIGTKKKDDLPLCNARSYSLARPSPRTHAQGHNGLPPERHTDRSNLKFSGSIVASLFEIFDVKTWNATVDRARHVCDNVARWHVKGAIGLMDRLGEDIDPDHLGNSLPGPQ